MFRDRWHKAHAEAATYWVGVADKFDDGGAGQILVFGKVELNVTCETDGGTSNRVTDGSPAIFDVGSSKRDIG